MYNIIEKHVYLGSFCGLNCPIPCLMKSNLFYILFTSKKGKTCTERGPKDKRKSNQDITDNNLPERKTEHNAVTPVLRFM